MTNYDIFLFDWDGTITDSMTMWKDIFTEELASLDLSLSQSALHEGFGDWENLLKHGLSAEDMPLFKERVLAQAEERVSQTPLQPGVDTVLAHLRRCGKKLGIVTSCARQVMEVSLRHHGMEQLFEVVVCGGDVEQRKPHPEAVHKALMQFEYSAQVRAILWGDADRDLIAAKRAKIDSGLFLPPHHAEITPLQSFYQFQPTHTITAWQELLDQLQ